MWNEFQVDRQYHALYMLLLRTRAKAMQDGPVTVRFTGRRAIMEDQNGGAIESLWLTTLHEVRYRTIQGDRRIIFSLWVHCSGRVTRGRNDDWTLNP